MNSTYIYAILSVVIVSMISLIGVFALSLKTLNRKVLQFLVSFAVGALLGDVFLHLLPELVESGNFNLNISLIILLSILLLFLAEGYIHWHHHHYATDEDEAAHHPVVPLNLVGDGLHNFIDGLIIGGAYLIDINVGFATTIAVILHEIPQEIGDFGVLVYGGLSKAKALFYNFLSALTALAGVIIALSVGEIEKFATVLVAIGVGSFIYISLADLVPEIHKSKNQLFPQLLTVLLGVCVMGCLLLLE